MDRAAPRRRRRWLRWIVVVIGVSFVGLQFVPHDGERSNPPVTADAPWPSAAAEQTARQSCYSCHSNETEWPVYSWVAPTSWFVLGDVEAGREELNFSTWPEDDGELDDAIEQVEQGEMPPRRYTLAHPGAGLSEGERRALVEALRAMDRQR